ncbi:Translocase of chloroplast 132- chloroplastic [Striga hermonthica]|uniref:Translocase of chloroplast 132- chloroplastic n=1 Tax=Striga hermonthica TaxID=68872 RepID=A0A9N7MHW1_STRHE|nr:Translocase of chloroplast 132- chloroplastic [Striga hermonthica]
MARPIGLGDHALLLKPTSRAAQPASPDAPIPPSPNPVEQDETCEKLHSIRVKFLRLVYRLGQTPANPIVAQLLYKLDLVEHLHSLHKPNNFPDSFAFERANAFAEQLESSGGESPFSFPCTILVLGKLGSGKSSTLNSLLNGPVFEAGPRTEEIRTHMGTVHGIEFRAVDTPGLSSDILKNERILYSVKRFVKNNRPDVVLYVDRLDAGGEGIDDVALMRMITAVLGRDIWLDTICVLTHASSAPPDCEAAGSSYGAFVEQRSSVLRRMMRLVSGDINRFMNPVALAENHPSCRKNRDGQPVLPDGQLWISNLLLLCFVSKILREASELLWIIREKKPLVPRLGFPSLPVLLSTFLQWRKEVKLPSEQLIDDNCSDSGDESEEYEKLPPFKSLTKTELEKLSKSEKKAYDDEVDYREKLLKKMQIKEEKMRREIEPESESESEPIIVSGPDLPASFDSDNPTYLYRLIHYFSLWAVGPVRSTRGWDHNTGFDGMYVDWPIMIGDKIPVTFYGQVFKNKNRRDLHMEIAGTVKHANGKATIVCLDVQKDKTRKDCILQSRTLFINRRFNKSFAGLTAALQDGCLTGGFKLEEELSIGRWVELVASGGANYGSGDFAYGGDLMVTMRDRDELTGRFSSSFGINFVDFGGDFAAGLSSHAQIPIGRKTDLIGQFSVDNRGSGQVSVKLSPTRFESQRNLVPIEMHLTHRQSTSHDILSDMDFDPPN